MKKEIKICLPFYKIIYSLLFVLLLSLIRGISSVYEIGIVLEPAIGFLTIIFCADTYLMERNEKRREVFLLYTQKTKTQVILRRLLLQIIYIIFVSLAGYGFFYIQKPEAHYDVSSFYLLGMYMISIWGTILFWGVLSMVLGNILQHLWAGIGISMVIWLTVNSISCSQLLGKWNIFAFVFRKYIASWEWMYGKILSILLAGIMIGAVPLILKKRG